MPDQLQMFAPVADLKNVSSRQSDVLRFIQPKPGPFRALPSLREFRLVELKDGRVLRQYEDGSREASPVACNRILIDDAVRAGLWVEEWA